MCKVLTEDRDLEWDMYYIGDIADHAANLLYLLGNRVRYPAVVTGEDESSVLKNIMVKVGSK